MSLPRLSSLLGILCLCSVTALGWPRPLQAAGPPSITGLSLDAAPAVVDVGSQVQLTVRALTWPAHASATVSFVSPHHGFSGKMVWRPNCNCFAVAVALARRIHPLETARAVAKVTIGKSTRSVSTTFQIRGLARNGRDFAPGGKIVLSGWVSDPTPVRNEFEHYCGWVKTLDGLGVPGYTVRFVVHYQKRTETWTVKILNATGVACAQRSIQNAKLGYRVHVDIFAAGQHADAYFTPRG